MRDSQVDAICKALAYIIKGMAAIDKSDRGQKERRAVLQGLQNARRVTQTGADDPLTGAPRASSKRGAANGADDETDSPAAPPGPSVIGVTIVAPDLPNKPTVREGSMAGSPFNPRVAQSEE